MEVIERVVQNPYLGKDVGYISPGYYRINAGSHLIFYRIDELGNNVMIIRISHEQMDFEARLRE